MERNWNSSQGGRDPAYVRHGLNEEGVFKPVLQFLAAIKSRIDETVSNAFGYDQGTTGAVRPGSRYLILPTDLGYDVCLAVSPTLSNELRLALGEFLQKTTGNWTRVIPASMATFAYFFSRQKNHGIKANDILVHLGFGEVQTV